MNTPQLWKTRVAKQCAQWQRQGFTRSSDSELGNPVFVGLFRGATLRVEIHKDGGIGPEMRDGQMAR